MTVRLESQAEPLPGYKLIERIGGGGFGEVWKCEAPGGFLKAIKFVFGDLEKTVDSGQQAEQELKALARVKDVRHPYILNIERYDIINGRLLIVMELADRSLWDRFKECRADGQKGIPREELLQYMEEAAEALDLMNSKYQLQHLDIKPQNLFLVHNHVKVADFGLAKDLEGTQAAMTGGVTPVYAAPETLDGWLSRQSDQYSLAIVFQELLTGHRPFTGPTVRNLIMQHLEGAPDISPLPDADQPIIQRALAKAPKDRFPTCAELVRSLKAVSPGGLNATWRDANAPLPPMDSPHSSLNPDSPTVTPDTRRGYSGLGQSKTHFLGGREGKRPKTPQPESFVVTTPSIAPIDEERGDGILAPAMVLGLGGLGLEVVRNVAKNLRNQFFDLEAIPCLRLLGIDTDPDSLKRLTPERGKLPDLDANQMVLAPLNRASHYLKPRDSRPPVESWLNPNLLYRIPRHCVTLGVRAFGRLAFIDHYRTIARRLRAELELSVDRELLQHVAKHTKLGLRSNHPRVFLVSSLCGGTGSGMLLDVAYLLREILRDRGYPNVEVNGILLVPKAEASKGSQSGHRPSSGDSSQSSSNLTPIPMGNSCATLTEIYHFATPHHQFSAQYHRQEPVLRSKNPPFGQCVLLPLPLENDRAATQEVLGMAGQYIYRRLCTGLGSPLAEDKVSCLGTSGELPGQVYQTFGLHQVAFPRAEIIRRVGNRLCQRLVETWMTKDAGPVVESVEEFVREQWRAKELTMDAFIERIQIKCQEILGQEPEAVLSKILLPLIRLQASGQEKKGTFGFRSTPKVEIDSEQVNDICRELLRFVGRIEEDSASALGKLPEALKNAGERVTARWSQKLAELPVKMIERPGFRLAGAEESVRQVVTIIESVLDSQENLSGELEKKCQAAYNRIIAVLTELRAGTKGSQTAGITLTELIELFRSYGKWRYQSLVLKTALGVYVSLRGCLTDELREINFCRGRLGELLQAFQEKEDKPTKPSSGMDRKAETAWYANKIGSDESSPFGRLLFPMGCESLNEAREQVLATLTQDDLLALDARVQKMLRKQFVALVQVCLGTKDVTKQVEIAIREKAEEHLNEWLHHTDVAELYLERFPDGDSLQAELMDLFEEAMPEQVSRRMSDIREKSLLDLPPSSSGNYLRTMAQHAIPGLEVADPPQSEDLVLYREWSNLSVLDLEQLGAAGQEAYNQLLASSEDFSPHSRLDVSFQVPVQLSKL